MPWNSVQKLSSRKEFFKDPLGKKILRENDGKFFNSPAIFRSLFHFYIQGQSLKINDLLKHYLLHRFFSSPLLEHKAFSKAYPLPDYIEEDYCEHFLKPLQKIFQSTVLPVESIEQPEIPFLKERRALYDAFCSASLSELLKQVKLFFSQVEPDAISFYYYFEMDEKLKGISAFKKSSLEHLAGYEMQKKLVLENTEKFLEGQHANNVFLYGSRGTGKTSLIKALLDEYKDRGLRLIKLYRDEIEQLPQLANRLKNRKEFFVINLDDISYDETELIYKKHKVAIDSFFDREPKNAILYATSNSQEIVKYIRQGNTDNMVLDNRSEEEKKLEMPERQLYDERRAFTERFGLTVFFGRTDEQAILDILDLYQKKYDIKIPLQELKKSYLKWVSYHGSVNGRTIENFMREFLSKNFQ